MYEYVGSQVFVQKSLSSVADPHHFDVDPVTAFHLDADPKLTLQSDAVPDPTTPLF
jgi:hypothetical protein